MSQIKQYLIGKQEEAEALAQEIEMRYQTLTDDWKITDPEVVASVLSEPISRLSMLWKELVKLGGRKEASRIPLPREICITYLEAKTWQSVQKWYQEQGLELDVEQGDYIAQAPSPAVAPDHSPKHR